MLRKLLMTGIILLSSSLYAFAQTGTISGTVTDATTGETLPGANVYITSVQKGDNTDANGEYLITDIPAGTYTLRASFVGYQAFSRQVDVTSGTQTINISLTAGVNLDELVVTGYGSTEKANLSSSISKVSREDIAASPVVSTDALLQGKAAGVQVSSDSGTPGGGVRVRVRGSTSISASNDPLYVIDGVPVNTGSNSAIGVGGQTLNALSDLNPNEIESIEVLKDASATAIYGSRGANGVVLVTTRSGQSGESRIDINYSHGTKDFPNQLEFVDSEEFLTMYVDGLYGDIPSIFGPVLDPYANWGTYDSRYETLQSLLGQFGLTVASYTGIGAYDQYGTNPSQAPTTDWQDAIFQTGITNTYNMTASGGDDQTQYFISGEYYDEKGIMINSGFEKLNGRVNLDHQFNERSSVGANVSYLRSTSERIENDNNIYGVLTNGYLSYPTGKIYNDDGTFGAAAGGFSNPVAESEITNNAVRTRFIGNLTADYELLDGLVLNGNLGLDRYDLKEDQFAPSFTNEGSPLGNGVASVGFDQTWLIDVGLNYQKLFNDVHDLRLLGVVSYQENKFERSFATGVDFPSDELQTINSAATTTGGSTSTTSGLLSYTARANYVYDNRYILTLTGRVDASSRFSEDNKYGIFPSAAIGWRITNEDFMQDADWINELKLRASVGKTGNQSIGNFSYQALFGVTSYSGQPALAPSQLPNPDLKWEETTQYDLGLDYGFANNRISGAIDAYFKDTNDLLLNRPVPSTTGFTSYSSNIGAIENKGLEFQVTTVNVQKQDFQWSTSLNISLNRNEVTKLYNSQPFSSGFTSRVTEGEPLGSFYGYVTDGIWNSQQEIDDYLAGDSNRSVGNATTGDVRFVDLNGDGVVNSADQQIIGDANPDFFGGFRNDISYKGLELNAFFQFTKGNDIYNNNRGFYNHYGYSYTATTRALDRWDPDNVNTGEYRSSWFDPNQNTRDSDFFIEDGSYLRLKTLTLAYNFEQSTLDRIGIRNLRLYATGYNLLTFTDYSGPDPEVNTFSGSNTALGTDFFAYPQARSFILGINLGL